MHDLHRAATQHVTGAHHQRVTQRSGFFQRLGFGPCGGVGRLAKAQAVQQFLETLAVFGRVNHVGRSADDGHAVGFEPQGEFQGRLAAVLDDHAQRLFLVHNFQHVFERERLEIQTVGGVVIGGDGFRVAIDHDGLVAVFAQRQRGVHTAVVKFNALPDAVRAATEHHDFFVVRGRRFTLAALRLVGRVQVRGVGGELGRAGVHTLVDRPHVQGAALLADGGVRRFELARQAAV